MNSENTLERAYNISCFVPSGSFSQQVTASTAYQQVNIFTTKIKSKFFYFIEYII